MSLQQRHTGDDHAILAARSALYTQARSAIFGRVGVALPRSTLGACVLTILAVWPDDTQLTSLNVANVY